LPQARAMTCAYIVSSGYDRLKKTFEAILISLEEPGEEFTAFEHAVTEFIHMLEGIQECHVSDEV